MRSALPAFTLSVVVPVAIILCLPRTAAPQNGCVTNPKISAPTTISPKSGDVISPVYLIKLTTDGSSRSGGINFRWAGSFKANETFMLEIAPVSATTRAISADAPTTTTRTGTTEPVRTTTSTTTLDAGTRLSSAALGALVYTTAPGARQHTVDLERGKSYRWRIRAYNCGADAPYSASITFSVEAAPPTVTSSVPAITSLSPSSVNAGQGPITLTVNGSNFASGAVVRWNGANRPTTFVSATRLTATIPASDLAAPSTAQITVSTQATDGGVIVLTASGSSGVSAPMAFQVLPGGT